MKNIIKNLAGFLYSNTAYLILTTLIGMYAVKQGRYAAAYGILVLAIAIMIRKHDKTAK